MSVDYKVIVAGLSELIKYFDQPVPAATPVSPAPAPTQKRGRGRPVAGEAQPTQAATTATAPATSTTTPTSDSVPVKETDPFAAAPAPAQPVATLDDVRAAYTALKDAVSQAAALQILKEVGGASNGPELKPEKYDAVVAAYKAAMPQAKPAPVAEVDPFATAAAAGPTEDDVRKAFIDAGKRTSQETAIKVVMAHGGKAVNPATGLEGPSSKALPPANYAACIAALNALPTTK